MMWDMRGMAESLPPAPPPPATSQWQRPSQHTPGFPVPQHYPNAPMSASPSYAPPIPASPYVSSIPPSPYVPPMPPSPYAAPAASPYMGSYNYSYQNQPRATTPSMMPHPQQYAAPVFDYYSDSARDPRYANKLHKKKHRKHSKSPSPSPHSHSSSGHHHNSSSTPHSHSHSHSHSRSPSHSKHTSDRTHRHQSHSPSPARHHHSRTETPSQPHHSHSHSHSASPSNHHHSHSTSPATTNHHSSSSKPSKHRHTHSTPTVHFAPSTHRPAPIVQSASHQSAPAYQYGQPSNHVTYQAQTFPYSKCTGQKKAVCIGINYRGQPNELRGCINDANNVVKFLLRNGYKRENIYLLTDEHKSDPRQIPTKKNILGAMRWLVQDACPNDSLFIHYSGHGGQVRDLDGDEVDGWDEAIYPVDFKKAGYIIDDEMHDIMVKDLPERCRLTALFDACHSGTVLDLQYIYSAHGRLMSGGIKKRKRAVADVISWSACQDDQTSADTFSGGVAFGAMSHAFIEAFDRQPGLTYQDLLKSVRHILKPRYKQKPQLGSSHHIDTTLQFVF
ncbi:hypothetical protein BDN72DRAFT_823590 [Pluteus cervinus]|uniref:Uncharacterized protein n=1 Tax=Pluteus cervinus TaxID=181527 RepID=A0ACD3AKU2_9AGAR|nr:hypothetical protein BDN72DRAFT_823590 [Pluteus cervinus]